jgi:hypothetical protein
MSERARRYSSSGQLTATTVRPSFVGLADTTR